MSHSNCLFLRRACIQFVLIALLALRLCITGLAENAPQANPAPIGRQGPQPSGAPSMDLPEAPYAVRPTGESSSAASEDSLGYAPDAAPKAADRDPNAAGLVRNPGRPPVWPHYGGVHEFGAWSGGSFMTGHLFGDAKDIRFGTADINYSYLIRQSPRWSLRYSPEMTLLAVLDQPKATLFYTQPGRQRSYGSGLSPVGFRAFFLPAKRVQPLLSMNGGFIYFNQPVLSPEGSQFMFTIDFGCGLLIYTGRRNAVTIGYRFQHMSNADTAESNPGTDANTFYLGFSTFRTKGYR